MVVKEKIGYVALNAPKLCWNKLFCKWCLVDGPVLEYIEWKVELTQVNNFDTIEMICMFEWFESCWDLIFWPGKMVVMEEIGYVALNPPKLSWNKLFGKCCLVDGPVLEYIEWKVELTQVNSVKKNTCQHDSSHSTTHISIVSKFFTWVNEQIYINSIGDVNINLHSSSLITKGVKSLSTI